MASLNHRLAALTSAALGLTAFVGIGASSATVAVPASKPASISHVGGSPAAAPGRTQKWSDEFTGSKGAPPNPRSWRHETGGGDWGNDELECYTDSSRNSALDGNGHLVITARHTPGHACADGFVNDYTSARLTTQGLRTFTHGRLAIRAKMPVGQGLWPAFWALGTNIDSVGWPACGEIDVVEQLGKDPLTTYGTIHGADSNGDHYASGGSVTEAPPWTGFHVYAADWTHRSISFSVDGSTYFTAHRRDVVQQYGAWPFDHQFFLLVNVAVGGSWGGPPDDTTRFPQRMVIDWVRVQA